MTQQRKRPVTGLSALIVNLVVTVSCTIVHAMAAALAVVVVLVLGFAGIP